MPAGSRLRRFKRLSRRGLPRAKHTTPDQRPERIAEVVVALLEMPFGQKPLRTVVDHVGVGPEIERYNDVLDSVTRNVMRNFGIEEMLKLNA